MIFFYKQNGGIRTGLRLLSLRSRGLRLPSLPSWEGRKHIYFGKWDGWCASSRGMTQHHIRIHTHTQNAITKETDTQTKNAISTKWAQRVFTLRMHGMTSMRSLTIAVLLLFFRLVSCFVICFPIFFSKEKNSHAGVERDNESPQRKQRHRRSGVRREQTGNETAVLVLR